VNIVASNACKTGGIPAITPVMYPTRIRASPAHSSPSILLQILRNALSHNSFMVVTEHFLASANRGVYQT
jgi:hypothetical protein